MSIAESIQQTQDQSVRLKPYDVPHKGLRNALSQLQFLAGKTDYTNRQEVQELYQLGMNVFKILTVHATDENEVGLAELEQRCPGSSQHDVRDHEKIHIVQDKLEKLLAKIDNASVAGQDPTGDGEEFYLAFSEFHSMYLEHTSEEERVTYLLLWKYFTDEELASHRTKIMKKLPPQTLLIWLRFIVPALSPKDRLGLLAGFRKIAPQDSFSEAMEEINKVLPEKDWKLLNSTLNT